MPTNRIATKVDAQAITANLPYKTYEEIKSKDPKAVVERMTIVCMGHEPDFKAAIEKELSSYKVDIEVLHRNKALFEILCLIIPVFLKKIGKESLFTTKAEVNYGKNTCCR